MAEIDALYHLHRFQILLNAKDLDGNHRFPTSFLYAVSRGIYPMSSPAWCLYGEDPYLECYRVNKEFMEEVSTYLDGLWKEHKPIPTFYELEDKYGQGRRGDLIVMIRYWFLEGGFDPAFYSAILKPMEHPTEASDICRDFSDDELLLV